MGVFTIFKSSVDPAMDAKLGKEERDLDVVLVSRQKKSSSCSKDVIIIILLLVLIFMGVVSIIAYTAHHKGEHIRCDELQDYYVYHDDDDDDSSREQHSGEWGKRNEFTKRQKTKEYTSGLKLRTAIDRAAVDNKTLFSFDDMYNPIYTSRKASAQWVGATNRLAYIDDSYNFVIFDVDTNETEIIIESQTLLAYHFSGLQLSFDESVVLITYDQIQNVQTASPARYAVYDIKSKSVAEFPNSSEMRSKRLLLAAFAPVGHGLSFIWNDDLWFQAALDTEPERLTTSGEMYQTRNGMGFWNSLGVLATDKAHWFSSDMKYLAYGSFESDEIYTSEHPIYGKSSQVYPYIFNQVYLKSGDSNHFGKNFLHVMDFSSDKRTVIDIQPPPQLQNQDNYFYRVSWRDNTHLAVAWCNREQQHSIITICDVTNTLSCQHTYEKVFENGWIVGSPMSMFIDEGEVALGVVPQDIAGHGPFQQVALISTPVSSEGFITYLTSEAIEVYRIVGFNNEKSLVYFEATDGDQKARHLYSVGTPSASASDREKKCLTCGVDENCQHNIAHMSKTAEYMMMYCQGPGIPKTLIINLRQDASHVLEDNAELKEALSHKMMPTIEYHYIGLADGQEGWAEFTLPPNMIRDGSVKYPLLLYPYGGPHGHTQADYAYKEKSSKSGGWEAYLASSENIITVRINGRGTGGRGDSWLYTLYKRLGTFEIQDQIYGAKYIADNFNFIDGSRIAVWGWSYGGFVTSHVIGDPTDIINCGIAVAPVTNFRYYYAGYTEAYMSLDTEEDNAEGYDGTDATQKAANFAGKNFMIAHGTLDDNVHFQNAVQLIRALSEAQVLFQSKIYVDENHGIGSYWQNRHLFLSMTEFLKNKCF